MPVVVVEIFRTNVINKTNSRRVVKELNQLYPECVINFDLDDCDHILRVEGNNFSNIAIVAIVKRMGFECDLY